MHGDLRRRCDGKRREPVATAAADPALMGGTQIGKRYDDAADTLELLCTKAGTARSPSTAALAIKAAKPLPASTERGSPVRLTLLLDMAADGFGDRSWPGAGPTGSPPRAARRSHSGAALSASAAPTRLVYLDVNGPAFPVAMFAAARAGVPLVPLNYRLGSEQLDQLLASHPKALAIADAGRARTFERAGLTR